MRRGNKGKYNINQMNKSLRKMIYNSQTRKKEEQLEEGPSIEFVKKQENKIKVQQQQELGPKPQNKQQIHPNHDNQEEQDEDQDLEQPLYSDYIKSIISKLQIQVQRGSQPIFISAQTPLKNQSPLNNEYNQQIKYKLLSQFLNLHNKPYFEENKIPILVKVASTVFCIVPQYYDLTIKWLVKMLRNLVPYELPQDDADITLCNQARSRRIGQLVDPCSQDDTIISLLDEYQLGVVEQGTPIYPILLVSWVNIPKDSSNMFRVIIDLQNLLTLEFQEVTIFHTFNELIKTVHEEVSCNLGIKQQISFGVKFSGTYQPINEELKRKQIYVDQYFTPFKVNKIDMLVVFTEGCPMELAQEIEPKRFGELICPISHLIMNKPYKTQCNHVFDQISICLALIQGQRCPICRRQISRKKLRADRKYSGIIKKLKEIQEQRKANQVKKVKQEEEEEEEFLRQKKRREKERNKTWKDFLKGRPELPEESDY